MKIIRYGGYADVDVEFLDNFHYIKTTTYSNFVRGQVKNPYDRDLFGVGYIVECQTVKCLCCNEEFTDYVD